MSEIGHNDSTKSFVDRLRSLELEIKSFREDKRELLAEAKSAGENPKVLREVVKRLMEDADKAAAREELDEAAKAILAEIGPLGEWAAK